jgi:hypothetical protein
MHVRRGFDAHPGTGKYVSEAVSQRCLEVARGAWPNAEVHLYVFSANASVPPLGALKQWVGPPALHTHADGVGATLHTFNAFLRADAFVLGASALSEAAALLRPPHTVYVPPSRLASPPQGAPVFRMPQVWRRC